MIFSVARANWHFKTFIRLMSFIALGQIGALLVMQILFPDSRPSRMLVGMLGLNGSAGKNGQGLLWYDQVALWSASAVGCLISLLAFALLKRSNPIVCLLACLGGSWLAVWALPPSMLGMASALVPLVCILVVAALFLWERR